MFALACHKMFVYSSLLRILQDTEIRQGVQPYHLQSVQLLLSNDYLKGVEFT